VSPVRYELGFYIPKDGILHSHRREHLKSYIAINRLGSVAKYELGYYIPENGILHSHRRETLRAYISSTGWDL
jgi:hypothetical protein